MTPDEATALAALLNRLGTPGFGAALLQWLAPTLAPAHATAFRFDADGQARVVLAAGRPGDGVAARLARVYAGSGLYRHDRLVGVVAGVVAGVRPARGPATDGATAPQVLRLRRADITDEAYGRALWDRAGLVDRLSALAAPEGTWLALNLYRSQASGPFSVAEQRRFTALAGLLLALLQRHLAAAQPAALSGSGSDNGAGPGSGPAATRLAPEAAAALLLRLPARLSAREREVCAYTLAGHGREGIALALGIAPSSVATLRRRAYAKLGIHSAGELFALGLQQARGPGG